MARNGLWELRSSSPQVLKSSCRQVVKSSRACCLPPPKAPVTTETPLPFQYIMPKEHKSAGGRAKALRRSTITNSAGSARGARQQQHRLVVTSVVPVCPVSPTPDQQQPAQPAPHGAPPPDSDPSAKSVIVESIQRSMKAQLAAMTPAEEAEGARTDGGGWTDRLHSNGPSHAHARTSECRPSA